MKNLLVMLLAAGLGVAGCASQIPVPTTYESSYQPKMLAAHHWHLLAEDVSARLETALAGMKQGSDSLVLFVAAPNGTVFSSAFKDMMETQLMQHGFGISRVPESADLIVEYEAQYAGNADIAVDTGHTEVQPPDDDILINVSVMNGNRYVTRISEIFYIDETTNGEYIAASAPPTRLIQVVGE